MLVQLSDRGPDSGGRRGLPRPGAAGLEQGVAVLARPGRRLGGRRARPRRARSAARRSPRCARRTRCSSSTPTPTRPQAWLRANRPDLRIMSAGERIEIYKEMGLPRDFVARFGLDDMRGSHALGHTRMATESRVTTEHSHPFSTGLDLCLVHNGSLSNHNRAAARAAPRGHRVPDRQRHRGRGRLPDVAAARGRLARAGARGLPRRPRRLLHVRGRHGRRLRRAARPDRLQARGAWPRPTTGSRWRPSTARSRCCRAPRTRGCGSPRRRTVYSWEREPV